MPYQNDKQDVTPGQDFQSMRAKARKGSFDKEGYRPQDNIGDTPVYTMKKRTLNNTVTRKPINQSENYGPTVSTRNGPPMYPKV